MLTHSAHKVAAEIRRRIPGVGVKKLHKLLYYRRGHHAANFDQPLFEETLSAWDMGPVVGQLWWFEKQRDVTATIPANPGPLGEAELNTIGYVVSRYGKLSGLDLEHLTHSESPWLEADKGRRERGRKTREIPVDSMIDFFRHEAGADETALPPLDPDTVQGWLEGADARTADPISEDSPDSLLARLAG